MTSFYVRLVAFIKFIFNSFTFQLYSINLTNIMIKYFLLVSCLFLFTAHKVNAQKIVSKYSEEYYNSIQWRNIGPFRGGRSAAVTGVMNKANLYYFGATGGGVWKTTDAGNTWSNISDGFLVVLLEQLL